MDHFDREQWISAQTTELQLMLNEAVESAKKLVIEGNETIGRVNKMEGPNISFRLKLQERRAVPELTWRQNRSTVGGGKKYAAYVAGLRYNRYRNDAFYGVPSQHRSLILSLEHRCAQLRATFRAIVDAMRAIEKLRHIPDHVGASAGPAQMAGGFVEPKSIGDTSKSGRESLERVTGFDLSELYG